MGRKFENPISTNNSMADRDFHAGNDGRLKQYSSPGWPEKKNQNTLSPK
jgi:hypothetical protein